MGVPAAKVLPRCQAKLKRLDQRLEPSRHHKCVTFVHRAENEVLLKLAVCITEISMSFVCID